MQIPALPKSPVPTLTPTTIPGKTTPPGASTTPAGSTSQPPKEDSLILSPQGQQQLEGATPAPEVEKPYQVKRYEKKPPQPTFDPVALREQAKASDEQAAAMAEEIGDLTRCLVIAMRIMSGDRVPVSDEQFLSEKNSDLYLRAILMRQTKDDPEEYDSVLPEEEGEETPEDSLDPASVEALGNNASDSSAAGSEGGAKAPAAGGGAASGGAAPTPAPAAPAEG